jgi:hypothetical protein
MSDILPLLLLPAVAGWWFAEYKQHRARTSLRAAIARARRPLLHDAGGASVVTVARCLETHPGPEATSCPWWKVGRARTTWEVRTLAAPLGLSLDEVIQPQRDRLGRVIGFSGASRFAGVRHGRGVEVSLGVTHSVIALELPGARISPFAIAADHDGRLVGTGDVPEPLRAALSSLVASRRWRGLQLAGDGARIALERPAASGGSWLHDLWITEFVADLVAPTPIASAAPATPAARHGAAPSLALGH